MPIILLCSVPGCRNGKACHLHRKPSRQLRGYGRKWQAVRSAFLARMPRCRDCGQPAEDLHHVVRLAGPSAGKGKLLPLCHVCHAKRTRKRQ